MTTNLDALVDGLSTLATLYDEGDPRHALVARAKATLTTLSDKNAKLVEALREADSAFGLVEAQHGLNPVLRRARDRIRQALGDTHD